MTPTRHSDKRRVLHKLIIIPVFLLAYLILYLLDTTCFIRYIFGITCPGCGLTRAWLSLFRLDIRAAFGYNAMFWSVPIMFIYYWKDLSVFKSKILNYAVIVAILLGFIINHALRDVAHL